VTSSHHTTAGKMIFGRYDEKGEHQQHQQPKVVEAQVGERAPRPLYPETNRS